MDQHEGNAKADPYNQLEELFIVRPWLFNKFVVTMQSIQEHVELYWSMLDVFTNYNAGKDEDKVKYEVEDNYYYYKKRYVVMLNKNEKEEILVIH